MPGIVLGLESWRAMINAKDLRLSPSVPDPNPKESGKSDPYFYYFLS